MIELQHLTKRFATQEMCIRDSICTSWATKDETVEQLIEDVNAL